MKLRSLGENRLLEKIRRKFSAFELNDSGVIVGIGDDAAVFSCLDDKMLVTTDMMNEGVHFDLNYTSAYQLGFKLVSVNVSDIYAMGGEPRFIFLNAAMREDIDEEFFSDFFDGIAFALSIYKLRLLGGDISSALNEMSFSATVVGTAKRFVTRAGANPDDKIYLTGMVGDSSCGLEILKRLLPADREIIKDFNFLAGNNLPKSEKRLMLKVNSELKEIDFNLAAPLIKRHLMPLARHPVSLADRASSMIDLSDGLFIDLMRICDESKVGAKVYLSKIPISPQLNEAAVILGLDPFRLAAAGGEDYELLFTLPPEIEVLESSKEAKSIIPSGSNAISTTCIGEITRGERLVIGLDGSELTLKGEGYQHFGIHQ